jgi:hypothetical protein
VEVESHGASPDHCTGRRGPCQQHPELRASPSRSQPLAEDSEGVPRSNGPSRKVPGRVRDAYGWCQAGRSQISNGLPDGSHQKCSDGTRQAPRLSERYLRPAESGLERPFDSPVALRHFLARAFALFAASRVKCNLRRISLLRVRTRGSLKQPMNSEKSLRLGSSP